MVGHIKAVAIAAAVLSGALVAVTSASAAGAMPAAVAGAVSTATGEPRSATQMLHLAQRRGYRGGYRGRRYYGGRYYYGPRRGGRWVGPAIGAGVAAVIIGGAIAASKERYRDRWQQCDDAFRTFRWSDGTYIPEAGAPRVLCPYLRD